MYITEQSARSARVSKALAIAELRKHNMTDDDIALFLTECGDRPSYKGSVVLDWLGY